MNRPTQPVITLLGPDGEQRLPFTNGRSLREILAASGVAMRSTCGGNALCGQCRVRIVEGEPPPPSEGERRQLQATQLEWGERLACQVFPHSSLRIAVVEGDAESEWRPLRDDEYFPAASDTNADPALQARPATDGPRYGVAVDLGTTHIRLTLWNLRQRRRLAGLAGHNPQRAFGADILTRLAEAAHSPASTQLLRQVVAQAIGKALAELAQSMSFALTDIDKVQVVGNTAMLALLAGKNSALLLDPDYWTRPIDIQPADPHFLPSTWGLNGGAAVRLVPALGGFVGSDLLAGVLATRLTEGTANTLLIDFGTNSEIALWDGTTLHVTSSAGGPAFEGSGIGCGMPGDQGAIYHVRESRQAPTQLECSILGNGPARGICGSGLVDAMACLLRSERLDRLGRLRLPDATTAVSLGPDAPMLSLSNKDIDVFQRAKAAIGGGVRWLCQAAGVPLLQLQRVYACGAFGRLLDIDNAQAIGLLPTIAAERIQLDANSALAGCEALLLAPDGETRLAGLQARTRLYNMAESETFEALFVDSLYIQPMES